jgi:hypothetical protein
MKKIVINSCFGGFGLSRQALDLYMDLAKVPDEEREDFWEHYIERDDPALIEVVERLGQEADGEFADLKIVEIPDDVEWQVEEYDGLEHVAEKHRIWN